MAKKPGSRRAKPTKQPPQGGRGLRKREIIGRRQNRDPTPRVHREQVARVATHDDVHFPG